jgi:hypothetical protein
LAPAAVACLERRNNFTTNTGIKPAAVVRTKNLPPNYAALLYYENI